MKKGLISLAASALLASSLMAAPTIAKDGTGDYLVAPMYTFSNGYDTKLVLMNTDNQHAYLIRGVVRSGVDSQEVMDFTLMMSPGDVWDATIKDNTIVSSDDSNWDGGLNESLKGIDTGYIEFYVLAELDNNNPDVAAKLHTSNYSDAYKLVTTDVASINKADLKNLFATAIGGENVATMTGNPDLTYVVPNSEINNDAIGGFVTVESTTNDTLSTTIPLFAFENTRDNGSNVAVNGYVPGTQTGGYIGNEDQKNIRDLLRYKYVSIPYSLDNSDARVNFTFLLDGNNIDEGNTGRVQDRTYKQNFRNMSEKFPEETISCLEGQALIDHVIANFDDAANPNISPYEAPTCTLSAGYKLYMANEVDGVTASQALAFEASKKYKRVITYQTKDGTMKTVAEQFAWNDVDTAAYTQGMFQIHDIQNVYDNEDNVLYDDGQTVDGTQDAAYIPTYYDIKIIDGKAFINWNYAITNK